MSPDFYGPQDIVSTVHPLVVIGLFGLVSVAAVAFAVKTALRQRDWLPVAVCVGAAFCVLNEPIYDILGKIAYADDQYIAYEAFGRSIPWFLVPGYVAWVGVLPYVISSMMAAGTTRRALYAVSIAGVSSVVVVELVNLWLGAWEYYGDAPLKYFGGVAAMAAVPLVGGLFLYIFAEPLAGWRRALAGFVIPLLALPMVFAATGWPLYFALYTDTDLIWSIVAIAGMTLLIVMTVVGAVSAAMQWHRGPQTTGVHSGAVTADAVSKG